MIKFQTIFYDTTLFNTPPINNNKYIKLFQNIKNRLNYDKIIYEKIPQPIYDKVSIARNRLITENNDKLLIFAIGHPTTISILWYKQHDKTQHISMFNGKAIIIDAPIGLTDIMTKQKHPHLFCSIFCDFKFYNIKDFIQKHTKDNFNINQNFLIK